MIGYRSKIFQYTKHCSTKCVLVMIGLKLPMMEAIFGVLSHFPWDFFVCKRTPTYPSSIPQASPDPPNQRNAFRKSCWLSVPGYVPGVCFILDRNWGRAFPYLFPNNKSSKEGLLALSRAWCKCAADCDIECSFGTHLTAEDGLWARNGLHVFFKGVAEHKCRNSAKQENTPKDYAFSVAS